MADRTSAAIFGEIFERLAKLPDNRNKAMAKWLWKKAGSYDFCDEQMGCDKALIRLGLAKAGKDEYGDETIIYVGR